MKTCCTCKLNKELSLFNKSKRNKDGLERRCVDCRRIYYIKNKDQVCKRSRRSALKRSDQVKKYQYEYYRNNTEKIKKRANIFYVDNKPRLMNLAKDYMRNKRQNNIEYRIKCNLRTRICNMIRRGDKAYKTIELIGCSIEQFMKHTESKFINGMSWDNYGKWHIDHIKPCALFNLNDPMEQKKCFNFSNTQPMWAKENISKGKKYA